MTNDYLSLSVGQKVPCVESPTKHDGLYDCESSKERAMSLSSPLGGDSKEIRNLIKVNKIFTAYFHKIIWSYQKELITGTRRKGE